MAAWNALPLIACLLLLLLGCASDPPFVPPPPLSPLTLAIESNDASRVRELLNRGADANVDGGLPLLKAVMQGQNEITMLLIEKGAKLDTSVSSYNGMTALHVAAVNGNADLARLLLAKGADPFVRNSYRKSPLDKAKEGGHKAVIALLQQAESAKMGLTSDQPTGRDSGASSQTVSLAAPISDVDILPSRAAGRRQHAYAVVIGIEQYRENLPRADFADRDASLVSEYLTKVLGFPEENVVVRVNDRAAKADLEKYFEAWLPNNVEKDSSIFIYYSGHGAPNIKTGDAYLVPYDGDPTFVEKTGYSLKRLYAQLEKLPAQDIIVVMDSCFSGAGGRSVLAKGAKPMGLSVEQSLAAGGKTVVLSASAGDQISSAYLEKGHGLLTYFFLRGLQGDGDLNKDGVTEMTELYEYVKPNVQTVARKHYNNEQTPQLLAGSEAFRKGGLRLIDRSQ